MGMWIAGNGTEFIVVFDDEARKLGHIPWLAQGTL
jgi:GMP synthase PP-ATPase subunit